MVGTWKKQWIAKEDTGTESNTEKEKGLASDSFKRACFNWGIGRELYTAPFIYISADKVKIEPKNGKPSTYDKFEVSQIGYDEHKSINMLVVINSKSKAEVYSMGKGKQTTKPQEPMRSKYITVEQCVEVNDIFSEKKWDLKKAMKDNWKIATLGEMTVEMYQAVLKQAAK